LNSLKRKKKKKRKRKKKNEDIPTLSFEDLTNLKNLDGYSMES
jgi:hypothetical protein